DNVPGVPGIGVKTAAELINAYGDLETLLKRAGEIKQPKRRETLLSNADKARISKKLVTLKTDIKLPMPIDAMALKKPDPEKLGPFLAANGFRSILARLGIDGGAPAPGAAAPPQPELTDQRATKDAPALPAPADAVAQALHPLPSPATASIDR